MTARPRLFRRVMMTDAANADACRRALRSLTNADRSARVMVPVKYRHDLCSEVLVGFDGARFDVWLEGVHLGCHYSADGVIALMLAMNRVVRHAHRADLCPDCRANAVPVLRTKAAKKAAEMPPSVGAGMSLEAVIGAMLGEGAERSRSEVAPTKRQGTDSNRPDESDEDRCPPPREADDVDRQDDEGGDDDIPF